MSKKLKDLEEYKNILEEALDLYPAPPLAIQYMKNIEELIKMCDMYIEELNEEEKDQDND